MTNKYIKHVFTRNIKVDILIYFLLLFFYASSAIAISEKEYEVKAAFIIKMVNFITWPENEKITASFEKLNLCIANGNQNTNKTHDLLLANGLLQKYFNVLSSKNLERCNLLFISKMPRPEYLSLFSLLEKQGPILTFSDTPGFAQQGVMINFYTEKQKIGFEVNWSKMKSQGFEISARVLKLARIIDNE